MNKQIFLETLLKSEGYNKINNIYSKDDYWFVSVYYDVIEGYKRINSCEIDDFTIFQVENWQDLKEESIIDILKVTHFIN